MNCAFHTTTIPKVLSEDQILQIHQATLDVLQNTGTRIEEPESLEILAKAGADVSDTRHVKIPGELIEQAIESSPSEVVLYSRNGKSAMKLGGTNFYFGVHGDCPDILDPIQSRRRRFLAKDAGTIAKVCDSLEHIDFISLNGFAEDCSDDRYAAPLIFAEMVRNTAKPLGFSCADEQVYEDVLELARIVVGGDINLRQRPFLYHYSEPTSPLVHSTGSVRRLIKSVKSGIPIVYTPMVMAGATGPCSFPGTLVIASADSLVGLVIAQLIRPGAAFIYGGIPGIMDMKTTIYAYGAPEMHLMVMAMTDMAHHYRLPMFGTAGCTDAKQVDQQAAIEATLSCYASVLSGANLVHDVALLDHAEMVSAEMAVLVDEIIGMIKKGSRAWEISQETLLTDAIEKVGPGGHFLVEEQTLTNFRQFWLPSLMDRTRLKTAGGEQITPFSERLRKKTLNIIETHTPEPLTSEIEQQIIATTSKWLKPRLTFVTGH